MLGIFLPIIFDMEGGGWVPEKIRERSKSFWFCFFNGIHDEHDKNLLMEIMFWAKIYHEEDTLVHIIFPSKPSWDDWRRYFNVTTFPALVLADDTEKPKNFIVFASDFLDEEPFKDPKKLVAVLDFYHNKLLDGHTFKDLKNEKVYKELSKVTKIAFDKLTGMLSFSPV
jgi:hypothetical protein